MQQKWENEHQQTKKSPTSELRCHRCSASSSTASWQLVCVCRSASGRQPGSEVQVLSASRRQSPIHRRHLQWWLRGGCEWLCRHQVLILSLTRLSSWPKRVHRADELLDIVTAMTYCSTLENVCVVHCNKSND